MSLPSSPRYLFQPSYSPPSLYRPRACQPNPLFYFLRDPLPATSISRSPSSAPVSRGWFCQNLKRTLNRPEDALCGSKIDKSASMRMCRSVLPPISHVWPSSLTSSMERSLTMHSPVVLSSEKTLSRSLAALVLLLYYFPEVEIDRSYRHHSVWPPFEYPIQPVPTIDSIPIINPAPTRPQETPKRSVGARSSCHPLTPSSADPRSFFSFIPSSPSDPSLFKSASAKVITRKPPPSTLT